MNKSLKYIRIILAALMLLGITALLLDTTGLVRQWMGWAPKVQLLPAVLALNVVLVVGVLAVTLLIGRFYCAVVCPMGIFQDIFTWVHKVLFRKHKFTYRKPANWLRYVVLGLFVVLMVLGLNGVAVLIAPYSAYARMVTNLHATGLPLVVAWVTLVVVGVMSFGWGRLWCNTICPVGSLLSLVSRYRLFGVRLDPEKCVGCRKCEHGCKAMCIDIDNKTVDHSRCVDCWNCLGECKAGALSFGKAIRSKKNGRDSSAQIDSSRRKFMATTAAVGAAMAVKAQEQKLDGGLAAIMQKAVPERKTPVKPFGARSLKNFSSRCTACQLCVSQCPEKVLRPSTKLETLMQPEMNYTDGYCRTACTRCSEVCPAGAIQPVTKEEKTAISIGRAITVRQNCLSAQGVSCGTCARHCPAAAISMVSDPATGHTVPTVDEARCIGCGACEYYCPARPMTAIYVEGREVHTEI